MQAICTFDLNKHGQTLANMSPDKLWYVMEKGRQYGLKQHAKDLKRSREAIKARIANTDAKKEEESQIPSRKIIKYQRKNR